MRRIVAVALPIAVGMLTLVLLVSFQTNPERILPAVAQMSITAIVAALAMHTLAHMAWAARMKVVAHGLRTPLPFRRTWKAVVGGLFAAELTPGRVGGEAFRSLLLFRRVPGGSGASVVAADRSLDYLFFLVLAPVVFVAIPQVYGKHPGLYSVALAFFVLAAAALAMVVILVAWPSAARAALAPFLAVLRRILGSRRGPLVCERVLGVGAQIRRGLVLLLSERKAILAAGFALTLLTWGLEFSIPWVLLAGFGHAVGWPEAMLAASLVTMISAVPLSLGSMVVAELTMFATVSPWIPDAARAAAFVFLWRSLTFGYDLAVGGAIATHEAHARPARPPPVVADPADLK